MPQMSLLADTLPPDASKTGALSLSAPVHNRHEPSVPAGVPQFTKLRAFSMSTFTMEVKVA